MASNNPAGNFEEVQQRVIELAIRLGALFVLLIWCFTIIQPFVMIVAWGIIVAIALYPVFVKLSKLLGDRDKLASTLLTLLLIAILVVPALMLTDSLINGAQTLADAKEIHIPAPPESVAGWPVIGERLFSEWQRAADDLPKVLEEFMPQLQVIGRWLVNTVTGTGLGMLQFVVSFVIAGILLAQSDSGAKAADALATRLAGTRGREFAALASGTTRNVALGIVGVSIFQSAMLSIGFLAIDLPGAGLLALLVLVLCIIQIGPGLVTVPAIIYVFSTSDTMPAVLFAIWALVFTLIDSVLKPLVFGRGASVPTIVIFLGAIGGMLAYGIIGLFVGAIVLSLGFKLYQAWLDETPPTELIAEGSEPSN